MADRRSDDAPLAPRRPLSGSSTSTGTSSSGASSASTSGTSKPTRSSTAAKKASSARERSATAQTAAATDSTAARPKPRPRGTRRARLRLVHLDPWSVMKTALLLSIAIGIVTVVAVAVVWSVLGAAGVWDSIDKTVADVLGGDSTQSFRVEDYVGTSRVLGFTMVVAAVNVLLITAISTLAAFLYNLAAALLGGIEVTLAEDER